jgi:hypothetical protein
MTGLNLASLTTGGLRFAGVLHLSHCHWLYASINECLLYLLFIYAEIMTSIIIKDKDTE